MAKGCDRAIRPKPANEWGRPGLWLPLHTPGSASLYGQFLRNGWHFQARALTAPPVRRPCLPSARKEQPMARKENSDLQRGLPALRNGRSGGLACCGYSIMTFRCTTCRGRAYQHRLPVLELKTVLVTMD